METATDRARRIGRETMDAELRKRGLLPRSEPVPVRKQAAAQPTAAELRERVAKLEQNIAETRARVDETRAERRVDEVMALLAKSAGDREVLDQARVLLRDPATDAAYYARVRGERYEAPVAKAAEPDRRAEIRKLLVAGDHAGLGELLRAGADYG